MLKKTFLISFLTLSSAGIIYLSCCKDCPTCPKAPTEEHIFFVGSYSEGSVKTFSVEQREFTDSLYIPCQEYGVCFNVIGNNEMLATSSDKEGVRILDLRTGLIAYSFPDWGVIKIAPGSKYFALQQPWPSANLEHLEIHQFAGFELIYSDTSAYDPSFDSKARYLSYTHMYQTPALRTEMVTYDLECDSIIECTAKKINNTATFIIDPLPINKFKKTIFWALSSLGFVLCASDVGSDTARVLDSRSTGGYHYVTSPDEKYLYFSAQPGWDDEPRGTIWVFDVQTEKQVAVMQTVETVQEPAELAITTDGAYLLAGTTTGPYYTTDEVALFNARSFEYMGHYVFTGAPGYPLYPSEVATKTK